MKTQSIKMQHYDWDKLWAGFCGFFGGMIAFVQMAWMDSSYFVSAAKAGLTALICGLMGIAGKHLYSYLMVFFRRTKLYSFLIKISRTKKTK